MHHNIKSTKIMQFLIFIGIAIAGFVYGYDITVLGTVLIDIKSSLSINISQLASLNAAVFYGGAISLVLAGILADRIGRKKTMLLSAILFAAGALTILASSNYAQFFIGRFIQGLGTGILTVLVPLYLSETAPTHLRGRYTAVFQLILTFGLLAGYLVGFGYAPNNIYLQWISTLSSGIGHIFFSSAADVWKIPLLFMLIPLVIYIIAIIFMPESPRYFLKKKQYKQADKALARIGRPKDLEQEIIAEKQYIMDHAARISSGAQCKKFPISFLRALCPSAWKQYYKPMLLILSIAVLQQLTGINAILQNISYLLETYTGSTFVTGISFGVIITLINFLVTLVVIFIIDRFERKTLIGLGTLLGSLALFSVAIFFKLPVDNNLKAVMVLIGISIYVFAFAFGPGACIWVILSELCPLSIRPMGYGIALALNTLTSGIVINTFLPITQALSPTFIFSLCALFMFLYFLVVYFYVPTVSGRSMLAIEKSLNTKVQS